MIPFPCAKISPNPYQVQKFWQTKKTASLLISPNIPKRRTLMKNHPLNYLVEHKRQDLITHPLVISLYTSKWQEFGFWVYYINLLIYMIFMILLNIYAYILPPPFSEHRAGL